MDSQGEEVELDAEFDCFLADIDAIEESNKPGQRHAVVLSTFKFLQVADVKASSTFNHKDSNICIILLSICSAVST